MKNVIQSFATQEFDQVILCFYLAICLNLIETELLLTLLDSRAPSEPSSSLILKTRDASAAGSTDTFLSSRLRFIVDSHGQEICLLKTGEDEVGVMMGWEQGISEPVSIFVDVA